MMSQTRISIQTSWLHRLILLMCALALITTACGGAPPSSGGGGLNSGSGGKSANEIKIGVLATLA
jgi:hypothetical protein